MSRLRLALLDASHGDTDTRRNFRRELDADLAEFDVTEGELPTGFDYDGVVVTGSASSVYWDEAWIADLLSWVESAIDRGLPTLGVCFGHQVVAVAVGGEVADMGEYELGYHEIRRTADDPLLDGVPDAFTAFTTHSDEVVALPDDATVIAENEWSVQGFRHGHVFGVQFHPEYDPETAESVTREKDLPDERIERVVAGITESNYAAACATKRLFENFTRYVRSVRDAPDGEPTPA